MTSQPNNSSEEVKCCEKCTCVCKGAVTAHGGCDNYICQCHILQKAATQLAEGLEDRTIKAEEILYCDRPNGKECKCICHQEDYPLPKDFPKPADCKHGWWDLGPRLNLAQCGKCKVIKNKYEIAMMAGTFSDRIPDTTTQPAEKPSGDWQLDLLELISELEGCYFGDAMTTVQELDAKREKIIDYIESVRSQALQEAQKAQREVTEKKIGLFRGQEISDMSMNELRDFARWASQEIQRLTTIETVTLDVRLDLETKKTLKKLL